MIHCLVLLPRIINWSFSRSVFIEFNLNHSKIFCILLSRSFKLNWRLILQLYIVLFLAHTNYLFYRKYEPKFLRTVGVSLKKQDHTVLKLYRSWLEMGGSRSPHFFKKYLSFLLLTVKCNYEILTKCKKLSRAQYLTCPDFFFCTCANLFFWNHTIICWLKRLVKILVN